VRKPKLMTQPHGRLLNGNSMPANWITTLATIGAALIGYGVLSREVNDQGDSIKEINQAIAALPADRQRADDNDKETNRQFQDIKGSLGNITVTLEDMGRRMGEMHDDIVRISPRDGDLPTKVAK